MTMTSLILTQAWPVLMSKWPRWGQEWSHSPDVMLKTSTMLWPRPSPITTKRSLSRGRAQARKWKLVRGMSGPLSQTGEPLGRISLVVVEKIPPRK